MTSSPPDPAAPPPLEQARLQTQLYAQDLARVYRRLREDERRLARLTERLDELSTVCLELAAASSLELAGERVARAYARWLGTRDVAVFASRRGRFRLVGVGGADPASASIARPDSVGAGPTPRELSTPPWTELGLGAPVLVVGLPGRGGQVVGLVAARAGRPVSAEPSLELLARLAGALLEAHLAHDLLGADARTSAPARDGADPCAALLGSSPALGRVRDLVLRLGPVDSPVLVLGATGTGKELVARALHEASARRKGPFVAVNCGALPEQLVESEVFGHEAGSFTGAQRRHRGKVELAQGGTLFLDELGELPRAAQIKLLRFLQDSRYAPVGAEEERVADVRIVAATNRDLAAGVAAGTFREDLLYRLNVFTIELPPLRARGDDAVELARALARQLAERLGRAAPALSASAERLLLAYAWPGNVRELRNVMERVVVLSPEGELDEALLPGARDAQASGPASAPEEEHEATPLAAEVDAGVDVLFSGGDLQPFSQAKDALIARFEARYCEALLTRTGGNIARAAREAGLDKKHLRRKLVSYGLLQRRGGDEADAAVG